MNKNLPQSELVFSVAPTTRGFGFALVEGRHLIVDWGFRNVEPEARVELLSKVEALLVWYEPDVIVLEDCDATSCRRSERVKSVIQNIAHIAERHGVRSCRFSKTELRHYFAGSQRISKHAIALQIVQLFPELQYLVPPIRKAWVPESPHLSVFEAIAFVLTYFGVYGREEKQNAA